MEEEWCIDAYDRKHGKNVLNLKGTPSFGEGLQRAVSEGAEDLTIEFLSAEKAVITVRGQEFNVKLSKQEHTEIFERNAEFDSLAYQGAAIGRGVVINTGKEISTHGKTIAQLGPVPKQTIEVLPLSRAKAPTAAVDQPPRKRARESSGAAIWADTKELTQQQLLQKQQLKQQQQRRPVSAARSFFLAVKQVPIEVTDADIRQLFAGLKCAAAFISPPSLRTSEVHDIFVQFESIHGANLALIRNGEPIKFRGKSGKVEQIPSLIESLSPVQALWVAFCCIPLQVSSQTCVEDLRNFLTGLGVAEEIWRFCELQSAVQWHELYNNFNEFEESLNGSVFCERLLNANTHPEVANVERIIQDGLSAAMDSTTVSHLHDIELSMHELAVALSHAWKLELSLLKSTETNQSVGISWLKRVKHLLEALYVFLWKLLMVKRINNWQAI